MPLKVVQADVWKLRLNPRNPRRMPPKRWPQFLRTLEAERDLTEARPVIALNGRHRHCGEYARRGRARARLADDRDRVRRAG